MARIVSIIVTLLVAYVLALLFSIAVWTFNDIRARSQNIILQLLATLVVAVFNVFGLILYFMLRPKQTLAEAYERSLAEETLLQEIDSRHQCPSCGGKVQDTFLVCPTCYTKLRRQCHFCTHLLEPEWTICPYCGR